MSSLQKKYKLIIIEPSEIVAAGLIAAIAGRREFVSVSAVHSLDVSSGGFSSANIVLMNPSVINFNDRLNVRQLFDFGADVPIVAIIYSPCSDGVLKQYDWYVGVYDTADEIVKKLLDSASAAEKYPSEENNDLSAREKSILAAVAKGKTNKEIANEFNLSIYTVVTHRKNISRKLGINSIAGLTVYAIMNRLIKP